MSVALITAIAGKFVSLVHVSPFKSVATRAVPNGAKDDLHYIRISHPFQVRRDRGSAVVKLLC